jgi:hypothetical protein
MQNPMPAIPPMPIPPKRGRGRGCRAPLGPLHDMSGRESDPALNRLHRGHIAQREQAANHRAEVQNLLQQRQQQQEQVAEQMRVERDRLADLQHHAQQEAQLQQQQQNEEQQRREAQTERNMAWARERLREAQQTFEEEERLNLEAHLRQVNYMRHQEEREAHTSGGSRSANHVHHQGELEAHTSRGSGSRSHQQQEQDAAAAAQAAEYERNRHHENQLRREEEAEQRRQQEAIQRTQNAANNANNNNLPHTLPKGRRPYHEPQGGPERLYLGTMNVECNHCHALHFESEKLSSSTAANKKFGSCCLQGQIQLPAFREPPRTLSDMLCGISPHSRTFKKNIRQYNATFAFASLGVKIDQAVTNAPGPYCFRINGELHHYMSAVLPQTGEPELFAQIYIHDPATQLGMRQRLNPDLNPIIMTNLQAMLHETHPYVLLYKQAFQIMREIPPDERQDISL